MIFNALCDYLLSMYRDANLPPEQIVAQMYQFLEEFDHIYPECIRSSLIIRVVQPFNSWCLWNRPDAFGHIIDFYYSTPGEAYIPDRWYIGSTSNTEHLNWQEILS